jgi:DNA-binding GntR family transcriptional regulator
LPLHDGETASAGRVVNEMTRVTADPRIWVRISADLREKLAAGVIAAGDTVPIDPLSREWGTSRATVAKALRTLEGDGLVRRYPGYGYCVLSRS